MSVPHKEAAVRQGFTVWLTGLSGAGKSTIATLLAGQLRALGRLVEVLDGDELRAELSPDLGFSEPEREMHVRRIGWICSLLNRHGTVAVVAAISPYRATRDEVRRRVGRFLEVHVDCSMDVLVARDPKGLYARALQGEIAEFTGVSAPYEAPTEPEVVCRTDGLEDAVSSASRIVGALRSLGFIAAQ